MTREHRPGPRPGPAPAPASPAQLRLRTAGAIPPGVVEALLAEGPVRRDAVARGLARLADTQARCPAEAVAATLVDCMLAGSLP